MLELTLAAAQKIQLAAQGLLVPPAEPAHKEDVLTAIRRMGALQIDTISVVARSPYLVLWSRLGSSYQPAWLDELLAEGRLFEYWAHAACFLPIEDYPLHRRRMLDTPFSWWDARRWLEEHRAAADLVLNAIRERGALRSADFEAAVKGSGGWWGWKEEKMALEQLFTAGELMIARRQNFQRVYDLRERVLPGWDDSQAPDEHSMQRALALRSVQALGVTSAAWVADYFRFSKRSTPALIRRLAEEGELIEARIENWKEPVYLHPQALPLAEQALAGELEATYTTLLSPFDPLIWDRARAKRMFNFDYTIEVYTPAHKRVYGYYVLPILHRGRLVGRLDAKAHRKDKAFEVRALHFEEGVEPEAVLPELRAAVQRCAEWHKTPEVKWNHGSIG